MYCPDCYHELEPYDHFCSECGSGAAFTQQFSIPTVPAPAARQPEQPDIVSVIETEAVMAGADRTLYGPLV